MASSHSQQLVQKLWNYCNVLRDDGLSYQDYIEQLTYLLFLKMAQEQTEPPYNRDSPVPEGFDWPSLVARDGVELEQQYRKLLEELATKPGMLGVIFRKSQNKITDPAKLRRLIVDLIDKEQWTRLDADVKGDAYEGLLEKNAQDVKGGAGQYFTPRPLIDAMVECVRPEPGETIIDPACGTGGFLLSAYQYVADPNNYQLDRDQKQHLRLEALHGVDIVDSVVRLCAMNLLLHGIGPTLEGGNPPVKAGDSLAEAGQTRYDVVLTNPPFGKKSSYKVVGEDGAVTTEREHYEREDFKFTTSNKQFNFLQHIMTILDTHGRAGVVLPDNVLFEAGRAGEGIRRRLLESFDFHTLLRLPTGIWYSPGVKANVLFFDKRPAAREAQTTALWVYDYRTNVHKTLKTKRLERGDFDDFIRCYRERQETERFRRFAYEELIQRDKLNLDIFWLKDDSLEDIDSLPEPDVLAAEIVENLEAALEQFRSVSLDLAGEGDD